MVLSFRQEDEKKGKEFLVNRVGLSRCLQHKNISIGTMGSRVDGENPQIIL
jgi:hypothetical protein